MSSTHNEDKLATDLVSLYSYAAIADGIILTSCILTVADEWSE